MSASVLVVDDEEGMRETLAEILQAAGWRVDVAHDGAAALRRLKEQEFDVVVMDIRMPGRDGVSVLGEIGTPPPRVIVMTAYAVESQLAQAIERRAFAVVHKPFFAPYMVSLVEQAATAA